MAERLGGVNDFIRQNAGVKRPCSDFTGKPLQVQHRAHADVVEGIEGHSDAWTGSGSGTRIGEGA